MYWMSRLSAETFAEPLNVVRSNEVATVQLAAKSTRGFSTIEKFIGYKYR